MKRSLSPKCSTDTYQKFLECEGEVTQLHCTRSGLHYSAELMPLCYRVVEDIWLVLK